MDTELVIQYMEKLGVKVDAAVSKAVGYLFPLAMKQAVIEGVVGLIGGLLLLVLAVVAAIKARELWSKERVYGEDGAAILALGVGSVVFVLISVLMISSAWKNLLNPEWVAILKLVKMVR